MGNVCIDRVVTLPKYLANRFNELGLSGSVRDKALKFLRILIKKSKEMDDGDMFYPVQISSSYLKKVFGYRYALFLNKLIESNIIGTTGKYSKFRGVCKSYFLVYEDFIDDDELSNIIQNCKGCDFNEELIRMNIIEEFVYTDFVKDDCSDTYHAFANFFENTTFNYHSLMEKVACRVSEISIDEFETDSSIKNKSVPVKYEEGMIWRRTEDVISDANSNDKSLIKDKNKYLIMRKDDFISRKKKSMFLAHVECLNRLYRGYYYCSRNSTNGRLDTNFTSMPSYLYEAYLKDNDMVELDLSCSQMAMIQLICDLDTDDYKMFVELVSKGDLYSFIKEELGLDSRKKAKHLCFSVLFSSHNNHNSDIVKFKKLFPSLMSWISDYKKENGSNMFSVALQRKESEMFVDNISKILTERKIIHFTKHDSISTLRVNKDKVLKIMKDCFDKFEFKCKIVEKN